MAARDRYRSIIKCPNCGQNGILHISEDDHPYIRNPHREIDEIEGSFDASVYDGREIKVTCKDCNVNFDH